MEILKGTKQRPKDLDLGGSPKKNIWFSLKRPPVKKKKSPISVQGISNLHFNDSLLHTKTVKAYQDLKEACNIKDRPSKSTTKETVLRKRGKSIINSLREIKKPHA